MKRAPLIAAMTIIEISLNLDVSIIYNMLFLFYFFVLIKFVHKVESIVKFEY